MEDRALSTAAMGNDCEHWLLTGGDDRLVAAQREQIIAACSMPHTEPMPEHLIRWRFPRYCTPVGGASFYYDIYEDSDLLEIQSPECATPFQLAASQEQTRRFFRHRLDQRIALGACGYVRGTAPRRSLRFAGSHLNVSLNLSSLPGYRTALSGDGPRQAMLYFLSTSQIWGGIGVHFAPEFEVRSRVIRADVANSCVNDKGLLQPGRDVPSLEVKETETYHYTHYESGWARGGFQRALAAATVAIDTHLGCHHSAEVLAYLATQGVVARPQTWHMIRRGLSQSFGSRIHEPVPIGERAFTHLDLLGVRLALYERLISDYERGNVPWVAWTIEQLGRLRLALERYPRFVSGALLGLDAIVKYEYLFRPLIAAHGVDPEQAWEINWLANRDESLGPRSPEVAQLHDELLGLNLLYHDFSLAEGPYEALLEMHPEVEAYQQAPQVLAAAQEALPRTRSRRRHLLMEAYASISRASGGKLVPCFAGFNRIGVKIGGEVHMHALGPVLYSSVTPDDWRQVRRYAALAGVDAGQVLPGLPE